VVRAVIEAAFELDELGHGVFTYYVLEGLQGKADRNGDGIVTVSELSAGSWSWVDALESPPRSSGAHLRQRQRPLDLSLHQRPRAAAGSPHSVVHLTRGNRCQIGAQLG
jgi:hypothetical protein